MKKYTALFLILLVSVLFPLELPGQILDFSNKVTIVLNDGTNVTLHGAANTQNTRFSNEYYYLPASLRLAKKKDGTPQFLFMKYTAEDRTDAGGVNGALMHFLMEWGLTPQQEKELEAKLEGKLKELSVSDPRYSEVTTPKVMGAANVKTDEKNSFSIVSAILTNNKSTPTLVTSGRAPVIPGGKVAVAALLEKNAAQLMAASFEKTKSITDVSIALRYRYDVLMPAVKGKIIVNWQRIDSVFQKYRRDAYHDTQGSKRSSDDYVKDTELSTLFSLIQESKAVDIQLVNLQPESEAAKQMVDAFMEYFLRSVSEKEFRRPEESQDEMQAGQKDYNYAYRSYKIDRAKLEKKIQRRTETYNLDVRLPINLEYELVENLASWYDGVRDNKKCVDVINLNDPFFEHRDVYLILDLDAEEMFGKELNFVTVDIRKRRSEEGANDFSRQVTFDKEFFRSEGNRAVVTYSKAQDENPGLFEYRVKWSLRGGNIFEQDSSWTQGSWEGLTLYPPVNPTPIKFEAELEDLKGMDIKNVTLQLRYYKFGNEVQTNFNINTSSDVGYAENNIYMDKNTKGYASRTVFYHKTKGPLATEWDAHLNTGYIYAVIPEKLRNGDEAFIDKMMELGKDIITPPPGGKEKILDQFRDLIKISN
ncbi:MAG: hypothetical protein WA004_15235 [Saprospiraceae bacterium]